MFPRLATALLLVALMACSDASGDPENPAPDDAAAELGDIDAFCAEMDDLQSGAVIDPDALASLYDRIESNAPAEIRPAIAQFVDASRAVSEAFAEAGAPAVTADFDDVMSGLGPDQLEFIEALAVSAQTGELPDGPTGEVLGYTLESCP